MNSTSRESSRRWRVGERLCGEDGGSWVMGVLNVTPDSFSDGGAWLDPERALRQAELLVEGGASILDVGGESTRPGAKPVTEEVEIGRTEPVVRALRKTFPEVMISIDTSKAAVARAALNAGADIINDVTGLRGDPAMLGLCVQADCAVVVMHMRGDPTTMQDAPAYGDVVTEVSEFFRERLEVCLAAGMDSERICFDPGIGFGKSLTHNLELLRVGVQLAPEGHELLWGLSRKSFIAHCLGDMDLALRDWPSFALTGRGRALGVRLHRVHDAQAAKQVLIMEEALLSV